MSLNRDNRSSRPASPREGWRRAMAVMLTGVLSFEAAFGNGLSTALADNVSGGGLSYSQIAAGQTSDSDTSQNNENNDATTPTPTPTPDNSPYDWTGDTLHLVLGSDGLELDLDKAKESLPEPTDPSGDADEQASLLELLPKTLSATLNLSFELDPTLADNTEQSASPAEVDPGDTFTVSLPEGVTLSSDEPADVFETDEQGEPTTIAIAEAQASEDGSSVKVTFVEPHDTAVTEDATDAETPADDELSLLVGDGEGEATEPTDPADPAKRGTVDLDVQLGRDELTDAEQSLTWTLQAGTDDGDEPQTATFRLPSVEELAKSLGVSVSTESNDSGDDEVSQPSENTVQGRSVHYGDERPATTVTTNGSTSTEHVSHWMDNNDADGLRPELDDSLKAGYVFEFIIDGEHYTFNKENAMEQLGWSDEQWSQYLENNNLSDDGPYIDFSESGNTYTASAAGLPTERVTTTWEQRTNDEDKPIFETDPNNPEAGPVAVWDSVETTEEITWQIVDENSYGATHQYVTKEGDETNWYFQPLTPNKFNIVGKVGAEGFDVMAGDTDDHLWVEILVDGKPVQGESGNLRISLAQDQDQDWYTHFQDVNGNQYWLSKDWELTAEGATSGTLTVTGPAYTLDNKVIEYRLVYEPAPNDGLNEDGTYDYYDDTYDNAASASHGGNTTELYEDGTLYFTHRGTTTFGAYKAWLDNNNEYGTRKDVSFTLVRYAYRGEGSSAANAAQVTDKNGSFITIKLKADEKNKYLVAGSDGVYDLGALLADQLKETGTTLEKYDPDGYPYIYALRESTVLDDYRTKYGTVDETGSVKEDSAPNYRDKKSEATVCPVENWSRGTDTLIYNTGTISNQLYDTVATSATKSWNVSSFADQLKDVTCTFTLQCAALNEDGTHGEWENAKSERGDDITQKLEGFSAEQLEQTFTYYAPLYNADGQKLTYRWIESSVQQGTDGEVQEITMNEENIGEFELTLHPVDGGEKDVTLPFFSSWDGDTENPLGAKGPDKIENYFQSEAKQNIEKIWKDSDKEKPTSITLLLYRNFDLLATITLSQDGTLQEVKWEDEDFQGFDEATGEYTGKSPKVSVPEDDPWHVDIDNLPQYSERGGAYTYRVFEGPVSGWGSERTYNDETKTTTITNSPALVTDTKFHLMKEWVDDADTSHQLSTHVNVYAAEDIYDSAAVNSGERQPGEGDEVVIPKGTPIAENLELSAGQTWFTEFDVKAPKVQMDQLSVVETELFDPANPEDTYPVVNGAEEALGAYGDDAAYWANRGWDASKYGDNQHPRAATKDHVYEVTIDKRAGGEEGTFGADMFIVNNRRIGLVDLTVKKTWVDEGADVDDRPAASFRLACDDAGATFATKQYTIGGKQVDCVVIKLTGGNELPIFKDSATSDKPYDHLLASEAKIVNGENGAQDAVLVVSANKSGESGEEQVQGFYGLPKYNGKGEIVHYTVEEVWDSPNAHGDYVSVKNTLEGEDAYRVNALHFHDEQTESFTNQRSATTSATFYKQWNDYYVNDVIGQRPDIRLSLYQVSGKEGTLKAVAGNPIFVWEEIDDAGVSENALDGPKYNQKCTVSNLPKYDSNGAEITYYAQEHMLSDGATLDYVRVSFDNKHLGDDVRNPLYKLDEDNVAASIPVEGWPDDLYEGENNEDAVYVIRQDGTFVNELSNTVTVRGTKRWGNTAGVVESEDDLPGIMLILQQRLQGSGGENDVWPGVKLQRVTADDGAVSYEPAPADADEPGGCLAWTTSFDSNWNYSMSHTGRNTADDNQVTGELPEGTSRLPKYDDNGQLYEYRVVEVMVGLIGTEGGLPWSSLEGKDLSEIDLHESNKVFTVEDSNTGQYTISNNYNPEKTSLTVKKILTGLSEEDTAHPEVELTLYRFYVRGEDDAGGDVLSTPVAVGDPVKISEFSEVDDEGTATGTYTFKDVDVFAPNGSRWYYYVVETPVDGYPTVHAGEGDLSVGNEGLTQATAVEDESGTTVGWESPEIKLTAPAEGAEDKDVDLTFSNAYVPGAGLTLTGTKAWDDQSNAFDLRPKLVLNKNLKLTRTTDGMAKPEDVTLTEGENGNFTWSETDNNKWTFTITGLEQWAPNGKPWTYKITESLSDGQADYVIENNSPTAQGKAQPASEDGTVTYAGTFSAITNRLAASATVRKDWDPATDPWGLQPSSVTVELQARVQNGAAGDDGTPTWGEWGNVNDVLDYYADGTTAPIANATPVLSQDTGWKSSWTGLPTQVRSTDGSQRYDVQYRVIETKVGNQAATISTQGADAIDPTEGKITLEYARVLSYNGQGVTTLSQQPSGEGGGAARTLSETVITNTLEGTSLKVTKVWQDDGNKWGTRPTAQDNTLTDYWHVEYYLQRTTDKTPEDDDWTFVKDVDGGYVTGSVTSAMDAEHATATFGGLPKYDEEDEYSYRVLEAAPAGYGIVGATKYTPTGDDAAAAEFAGKTLWVVDFDGDGGDVAGQTFINSLSYINFRGTKTWDDHGTGLAPTDPTKDGTPTLSLQRTTAESPAEKDWETVTYVGADGNDVAPVPTWTVGRDNVWTWMYTGLPQKDAQGDDYTYRVKETASVPGFSIDQGASVGAVVSAGQGGAGTTQDEGSDSDAGTHQPDADQVGANTLKNVATRFTFDKVNDEDSADKVWNVELAVVDEADPTKVFAIWRRDGDGTTTSYVWQDGIEVGKLWANGDWKAAHADVSADKPRGAKVMEGDNAGSIIGLKADTYTVIETGPLSTTEADNSNTVYHARLTPFQIRVGRNADGGDVALVTATNSATCAVDKDGLATITAVDPIFRAHFTFTKVLSSTGERLKGVEFKLQRKNASGVYEDVAEGITTNESGMFESSKASSIELKGSAKDAEHTYLSDGLITGEYRLVEVSVPEDLGDSIYWDNNVSGRTSEFTIAEKDHGQHKGVGQSGKISNPAFNARVSLKKYDDVNGGTLPLEGAVFELYFRAADSTDADAWVEQGGTYETDANGVLTVTLSRKGQYRLVEVENPGYELDEDSLPTVEFVLENEDHQAADAVPYDLTSADVQEKLSVTASNIAHQESTSTLSANGIPNHRLPGEVTLRKVDAKLSEGDPAYGIDGTTFKLQRQKDDGSGWEDFAKGLNTGNTYAYDQDQNAMGSGTANAAPEASGTLKVTGLPWGTYKFVETAPAPGYEGKTPDGAVIESMGFVIGADAATANGNPIKTTMGSAAISVELPALENNKTGIDLVKLNTANNDQLAGATFTLVPADGSAFNDASDPTGARTFTTGADGKATIPEGLLIVGNSYIISEATAPAGYELMEGSFTFTVRADGAIEAAVQGTEADEDALGYRVGADKVTLEATDKPIDLLVTKQGEGGAALADAEFKIDPQGEGDGFVASWLEDKRLEPSDADGSVTLVTDADGKIDLTGALIQGKVYTLVETAAPEGYEVVAPLTFQVGSDGSLTPGTLDAGGAFTAAEGLPGGYALSVSEGGVLTLTVTDSKIGVQIEKRGIDGVGLSGATFTIKPATDADAFDNSFSSAENPGVELERAPGGAAIQTVTVKSGADGRTPSLEGLFKAGNSYVVTETVAPDGYEPAGSAVIRVNADGTLSVTSNNDGTATFKTADSPDAATLIVNDEPIAIQVVKTAAGDLKSWLPGAEFTITPEEGSAFADPTLESYVVTTDADGTATVAGVLKADNTYTIQETKPPAGYEINPGSLTFTVSEQGTISTDDPTSAYPWYAIAYDDADEAVAIMATDAPIELQLRKLNLSEEPLAGAVFEIRGVFADGSTFVRVGPTGENGYVELPSALLVADETYTIEEVTAPAGYQRLGEFTFTVTEGGVFKADATSTGSAAAGDLTAGYRLSADGLTLVAVDAPRSGGGDNPGDPEDPDPEDPDDPDGPEEPEDPEDPDDPDEPDEPDEPGDPDEPVDPDDPDEPVDPDDPDEPEEPGDPDEPGKPGEPGEPGEEVPDAGDHTNVGLPVALMLAGVVLVTSAALVLRRRGQDR